MKKQLVLQSSASYCVCGVDIWFRSDYAFLPRCMLHPRAVYPPVCPVPCGLSNQRHEGRRKFNLVFARQVLVASLTVMALRQIHLVPELTYYVSSGTLNSTQSVSYSVRDSQPCRL